jgi:cobaltochelatase CobS
MSYATTFAALPARTRVKKPVSDVFGIDAPAHAMVEVYQERTPYVPEIDQTYVFDKKQVKKVLQWLSGRYKKNLLLTGPTGCGKSSIIEQVAARLGIEVFRVACHGKLEFPEILGSTQLVHGGNTDAPEEQGLMKKAAAAMKSLFKGAEDGESLLQFLKRILSGGPATKYVYGPAINAASRYDGGILLLDEGNFLHPSTMGAFNTVLDNGPLMIAETGENIWPKPGFRIAFTGNAVDDGDDMALHKGVQRMNVAMKNRFLAMRCDYMDPIQELKVIGRTVRLPGHIAAIMVQTAKEAREAFKAGIIETVISTRTLVTWAKLVHDDQAGLKTEPATVLKDCLDFALLDLANTVDADAIRINLNKSIETNPAPPAPVAPPAAPAGVPASSAGSGQFTANFLVSENSGEPKVWGMYRAPNSSEETIFYGALTGTLKVETKPVGYFQSTRPTKLQPGAGKPPYGEITAFSSQDPSADLRAIQDAYKLLISGSRPQLASHIAKAVKEVLPLINRTELLTQLP